MRKWSLKCLGFIGLLTLMPTAEAAIKSRYPVTPSEGDTYSYYYGYPNMKKSGDYVQGTRSSSGLTIDSYTFDLYVNSSHLTCSASLNIYIDGTNVGYASITPSSSTNHIYGTVTTKKSTAASHQIKLQLSNTIYASSCSYSYIVLDDHNSYVMMTYSKADSDKDGYEPVAYGGTDCDDNNKNVHPGATESCNGYDDDCDGLIDDADTSVSGTKTYYRDADVDTYGSATSTKKACSKPAGYVTNDDDCDDSKSNVYPGAVETCNGYDDDCDNKVDDNDNHVSGQTQYWRDFDSDGYGAPVTDDDDDDDDFYSGNHGHHYGWSHRHESWGGRRGNQHGNSCKDGDDGDDDDDGDGSVFACSQPSGYSANDDDCNDDNENINPGEAEVCNSIDDDCDGATDEGVGGIFYLDADGDNYGDSSQSIQACNPANGFVAQGGDCDDTDELTYPGAPEVCDGIDNDCDNNSDEGYDQDYDGIASCEGDCDDFNANSYPGAAELCDGQDNNCDGTVPSNEADTDTDGQRICQGDCNDTNPDVSLGGAEFCDGLDNDCNGVIPSAEADADGDGHRSCDGDCDDNNAARFTGNPEVCDGMDNDCDGIVPSVEDDTDGDGHRTCGGDCDDNNAARFSGNPEICDGIDNDCSGGDPTNEADVDADGQRACAGDCDDNNAERYAGNIEVCDGIDNDCDGITGPGEVDADGDNQLACGGDCDDNNPARYTGNLETCDGVDNDCDNNVPASEADADNDGQRVCENDCDDNNPARADGKAEICDGIDNDCDGSVPANELDGDHDGVSACGGDCDDANAARYPGKAEVCDGIDNNCDNVVPATEADADGDGQRGCAGDCDDSNAARYSGNAEACDGIDNNCDGVVPANESDGDHDGVRSCAGDCDDNNSANYPGNAEVCDGQDNNCDGNASGEEDADTDGVRVCNGDCDDNNDARFPGNPELCDGIDNNCDGVAGSNEVDSGSGALECEAVLSIDQNTPAVVLEQGQSQNIAIGTSLDVSGTGSYYVDWTYSVVPSSTAIESVSQFDFPFTDFFTSDVSGFINIALKTDDGSTPADIGVYTVTLNGTTNTGATASATFTVEVVAQGGTDAPLALAALGSVPGALDAVNDASATTLVTFTMLATGPEVLPSVLTLEQYDAGTDTWIDVGDMFDDGLDNDLLAGDAIYSGTVEVVIGTTDGVQKFRARALNGGLEVLSGEYSLQTSRFNTGGSPGVIEYAPDDNGDGELVACGRFTALFTEDATPDQVEAVMSANNADVLNFSPPSTYEIEVDVNTCSEAAAQAFADAFTASSPLVVEVLADVITHTNSFPNDTNYALQPYMHVVRADEAWLVSKGTVLIGAVDTGVDFTHPELPLTSKIINGTNFVTGSGTSIDTDGHGTNTAGLMAGLSNNNNGITGLSWNSKVLAVRGINGTVTQLSNAIKYAADQGAKVINVSGGTATTSATLSSAVTYAVGKGSLVVCAAGGGATTTQYYPAAYTNAFAVSGTNNDDTRADNMRYGPWVDIAAPAVGIYATDLVGAGGYSARTGTSQASAIVAGAAAVVWSEHPTWTATQVRTRLEATARPLDASLQLGAGRVDLFEAVFHGDFEMGDLAEWTFTGTCSNIAALGPIVPPSGGRNRMAYCSSGPSDALTESVLENSFVISANVPSVTVTFEFNFVSEEYPEWVGLDFDDTMLVSMLLPDGSEHFLEIDSVNSINAAGFSPVSGIDFPGGDNTVGQTGWRTATTTLNLLSGPGTYRLVIRDLGDALYDTVVLLDHVRFSAP